MNKKMRPVNETSRDMCAACDTDLATCDTVWAAEGILYCSRECGIHDFKVEYGDDAEKHFDEVAEELNPRDIGIELEVGYQKNEWCVIYVDENGDRQYVYMDTFEQANGLMCSIRAHGTCIIGMTTTSFKNNCIKEDE